VLEEEDEMDEVSDPAAIDEEFELSITDTKELVIWELGAPITAAEWLLLMELPREASIVDSYEPYIYEA
jgi:hypothetical protein